MFPLPFSLSPSSPVWLAGGEIADMESRHHLKVVKSSLSPKGLVVSVCVEMAGEGERGKSGNHILRVSGTDGHDMPNSPFSLPPLCRNHSPFASASSKWVLSLSLCPNLHRSCDINSANHLRSAEEEEEGAASECSADGATDAAQGC